MTLYERSWQLVANLAATATRLVPRRARYPVALRIARVISRVAGPLLMKREYGYTFSTLHDETLRAILRVMARQGITYEPRLRLAVPDDLAQVVREHGAIFVGAHFPLSALVARFLHDHGCRPVGVLASPGDNPFIWGTRERMEHIVPDPMVLLLKFRRHIRDRRAIAILIDRRDEGERTQPVETPFGTVFVTTHVLDFARRNAVPTYWFCVHSDETGVPMLRIERIEPQLSAFAALLREHAERVKRYGASSSREEDYLAAVAE